MANGKGAPFGSYQWQIAPAMKPNDIFGIAVSRADLIGDNCTTSSSAPRATSRAQWR
jgi:hypothetical protein